MEHQGRTEVIVGDDDFDSRETGSDDTEDNVEDSEERKRDREEKKKKKKEKKREKEKKKKDKKGRSGVDGTLSCEAVESGIVGGGYETVAASAVTLGGPVENTDMLKADDLSEYMQKKEAKKERKELRSANKSRSTDCPRSQGTLQLQSRRQGLGDISFAEGADNIASMVPVPSPDMLSRTEFYNSGLESGYQPSIPTIKESKKDKKDKSKKKEGESQAPFGVQAEDSAEEARPIIEGGAASSSDDSGDDEIPNRGSAGSRRQNKAQHEMGGTQASQGGRASEERRDRGAKRKNAERADRTCCWNWPTGVGPAAGTSAGSSSTTVFYSNMMPPVPRRLSEGEHQAAIGEDFGLRGPPHAQAVAGRETEERRRASSFNFDEEFRDEKVSGEVQRGTAEAEAPPRAASFAPSEEGFYKFKRRYIVYFDVSSKSISPPQDEERFQN
eukprot:CAMPEP_0178986558 /NCGR_PEP_ID=MMETSP0795-20121207/2767_1 /TAXON_ID=88552 /ORGANISM="Amoebophrya sp., Strain Ameob2" /LENGTH=442 /DNA_ID=CAMNT_0020677625 /DNA_START=205 /DNA_END=1536 /DNA_ORIENTATION=-